MEKQFIATTSLSPTDYQTLTEYFLSNNHAKLLSFSLKSKRNKLIDESFYQVLVAESIFQSLYEGSTFQSSNTNNPPIIGKNKFQKAIAQCKKAHQIIENNASTPTFLKLMFLSIYGKCLACDGRFKDAIETCFIPLSSVDPSYLTSLIPISSSLDFITIFRIQSIWAFSIAMSGGGASDKTATSTSKTKAAALPPLHIVCNFIKQRGIIDGGAFKDFSSSTLLSSSALLAFLRHSLLREALLIRDLVEENRLSPSLLIGGADPMALQVEGARSLRIYTSRNDTLPLEDFTLATETLLGFLVSSIARSNYHSSLDPEIIGIQLHQQQQNDNGNDSESIPKLLQPHSVQEDILWCLQRLPNHRGSEFSRLGLDEERWRREHSGFLRMVQPTTICTSYKRLLLAAYAANQWLEVIRIGSIIKLAPGTIHFNILILVRLMFKSLDADTLFLLKDVPHRKNGDADAVATIFKALMFKVDVDVDGKEEGDGGSSISKNSLPPLLAKLNSITQHSCVDSAAEDEDPYNLHNDKANCSFLNLLLDVQYSKNGCSDEQECLTRIAEFTMERRQDRGGTGGAGAVEEKEVEDADAEEEEGGMLLLKLLEAIYNSRLGKFEESIRIVGRLVAKYTIPNGVVLEEEDDGDGNGGSGGGGASFSDSNDGFSSSTSFQSSVITTTGNNPHFPYGINPDAPTVYSLTTIKSSLSSNDGGSSSLEEVGPANNDNESVISGESLICTVRSPIVEEKVDPFSFDEMITELLCGAGYGGDGFSDENDTNNKNSKNNKNNNINNNNKLNSSRFRSRFYPPTVVEGGSVCGGASTKDVRGPAERFSLTTAALKEAFPAMAPLVMAKAIFDTTTASNDYEDHRRSSLQLIGSFSEIGIRESDLLAFAERLSLLRIDGTGSLLLGVLLWSQLSLYYLANGDTDEAVLCHGEAFLMAEIHPLVHTVEGCIMERKGQWSQAVQCHERSLALCCEDASLAPRSLLGCSRSLMEQSKDLDFSLEKRKNFIRRAYSMAKRAKKLFADDDVSLFGRMAITSYGGGQLEAESIMLLIMNEALRLGMDDSIFQSVNQLLDECCFDGEICATTAKSKTFVPFSKKEIARWIPVLGGIF